MADDASPASPFDSLLHTLLTLRQLPQSQRQHWQAMFNYFAFHADGDPAAHLPGQHDGMFGKLSDAKKQQIIEWLSQQLKHM